MDGPDAAPSRRLVTRAPAKVNLTLEVLGRRPDGYHTLDSLVAFAGVHDTLALAPGTPLSLAVSGPFAEAAGAGESNLVLRAAHALAARIPGMRLGAFTLVKRLPVAAGLGGGSSDAAAALRLLARLNRLGTDHPAVQEAARGTGADVAVCLHPRARAMGGIGDRVGPALGLPPLAAILVNPGVPLATADVFRALGAAPVSDSLIRADSDAIPINDAGALLDGLAASRNDLEAPALRLCPPIGDALAALRAQPGCRLARMSGSGATCFGLFTDRASAAVAARRIRRARPGWWVAPTRLR